MWMVVLHVLLDQGDGTTALGENRVAVRDVLHPREVNTTSSREVETATGRCHAVHTCHRGSRLAAIEDDVKY